MIHFLFVLILSIICDESEYVTATVFLKDGVYNFVKNTIDKENGLCYAAYNPQYLEKGWDTLILNTTENFHEYTDDEILYCVGFLEGSLLYDRIDMYYDSVSTLSYYGRPTKTMPQFAIDFLTKQKEWVEENLSKTPEDQYFQLANHTYSQLYGLMDGHNSVSPKQISFFDMYLVFSMGDMMNILQLEQSDAEISDETVGNEKLFREYSTKGTHCSAFITYDTVNDDIYFSHTTWGLYTFMVRVFKIFTVRLNNSQQKTKTVYFSSYPGASVSTDDFYVTAPDGKSSSSSLNMDEVNEQANEVTLMVMETTLSCYNSSLSSLIVPQSMLFWQRMMISNWFSESATDWTLFFGKYNSGTYNNEWLVLNAGRVFCSMKKNKDGLLPEGTLLLLDQIPGSVYYEDVSDQLSLNHYFASYNVPYGKSIYKACAIDEEIKKHPEEKYSLDYSNCTRAKIFKRDAPNVRSIEEAKRLIRYNNYTKDPDTLNNPSYSVCARQDLDPSSPFCSGGIDGKVVSVNDFAEQNGLINIISSPTYEDTSEFGYDKASCCSLPFLSHTGQPNQWEFPWMTVQMTD